MVLRFVAEPGVRLCAGESDPFFVFFADPVRGWCGFGGFVGVCVRAGEFEFRGRFPPCFGVDGAALRDDFEVALLWLGSCCPWLGTRASGRYTCSLALSILSSVLRFCWPMF